jgi:hypothetical protein
MRWTIRELTSSAVVVCLAVLVACSGSRPSETEIRACVAAAPVPTIGGTYGSVYGDVLQIEFGTTITSQGGLMEPPKGTSIYPIKAHFAENHVLEFWAFKDSFGTLKCARL